MALTKIDDRGLTTPIDLLDSEKIRFGTGNDLELYHDSSHSYIDNVATGDLFIRSTQTNGDVNIVCSASNGGFVVKSTTPETIINAVANGSVELYYDNSKKLETYADGIKVYDDVWVEDNGVLRLGTRPEGGDLQIFHDGSNSWIKDVATGGLILSGSVFEVYNQAVTEKIISATENAGVELYYDNSKKLETATDGVLVNDSVKYMAGYSADLQIYHDGTDSYINNSTGVLYIRCSGGTSFKNTTGAETFANFQNDGAVELFYDNSKKLETASGGVTVTGTCTATAFSGDGSALTGLTVNHTGIDFNDNVKALFGTGDDMEIYHNGSDNIIYSDKGDLKIISEDDITAIKISEDGTVDIGHNADNIQLRLGAGSDLKLYHDGTNSYIQNATGDLRMASDEVGFTNAAKNEWLLNASANGAAKLYYDNSEYLRTFAGGVLIQTTSTFDDVSYARLQVDGVANAAIAVTGNSTGAQSRMSFFNPNGRVGYISTDGSATSYHTSSDYRLKENEVPISDGITRLKTLKPYRFNFKADPTKTVDGFFAHEVTAVPEAIDGKKDGVNMQAIDQSKLVPLLTAALQEAIAKIETLEAKVAALESS